MEIEKVMAKIEDLLAVHNAMYREAKEGKAYYGNDNDIRRHSGYAEALKNSKREENPLRNADFRIPHNWHNLLVNQKAAYLFTYAPLFNARSREIDGALREIIGEEFPRIVKELAIEASNTGVGWLHCWLDPAGRFRYAPVPSEEVVPVYSDDLSHQLEAVLRRYTREGEKGAEDIYEIWTRREAAVFERVQGGYCLRRRFDHQMRGLPFVPFYNNGGGRGDLVMYKDLIDQYDRVVSGFANDLADIQEVIFVLRNYGGEDLSTFLSELKRYKAIKVEGDSISSGGVETMQIEIPMEARVKFLEILRRQIFISGQGVDPDPQNFGNASGVALKYLYSLLEIKAGLLETEFRAGLAAWLRLIFAHLGLPADTKVEWLFYRNAIGNDLEAMSIAKDSAGLISRKTILQNHPWVEDVEEETRRLNEENACGTPPLEV